MLQKVFNRRIPLMRFFLKQQLFWVPVLGLAWWALDFPFMGRYSRAQIARDPGLGQRDMEATRRACEKFREMPVAVMNFVEGTRFTPGKHARQANPTAPASPAGAGLVSDPGDALHARGRHHRYTRPADDGRPEGGGIPDGTWSCAAPDSRCRGAFGATRRTARRARRFKQGLTGSGRQDARLQPGDADRRPVRRVFGVSGRGSSPLGLALARLMSSF